MKIVCCIILIIFFSFSSFSFSQGGSHLRQVPRQPVQQPEFVVCRQLGRQVLQGRQDFDHIQQLLLLGAQKSQEAVLLGHFFGASQNQNLRESVRPTSIASSQTSTCARAHMSKMAAKKTWATRKKNWNMKTCLDDRTSLKPVTTSFSRLRDGKIGSYKCKQEFKMNEQLLMSKYNDYLKLRNTFAHCLISLNYHVITPTNPRQPNDVFKQRLNYLSPLTWCNLSIV